MYRNFISILILYCLLFTANGLLQSQSKSKTMDNLQESFAEEENSQQHYMAFSKKADEEGYKQIASLFRAAAKSEEIHKKNYSEAIKKLGGNPKSVAKDQLIKSTKENLQYAINEETEEMNKEMTDFLAQAKVERNKDAIKAFNGSKEADKQIVKLLSEALQNLDKSKKEKISFMVCPTCGYTVIKLGFDKCPVCYTEKEKFLKVE